MSQIFTLDEVATKLKVHPMTIRRYIKKGILPAIKLGDGKVWRINEDDLNAFLERFKKGGRK